MTAFKNIPSTLSLTFALTMGALTFGATTLSVPQAQAFDDHVMARDMETLFVGATVLTMDGGTVYDKGYVRVKDGVITEVGPMTGPMTVNNVRVIPSQGKFIMPGLVEAHGHLPFIGNSLRDTEEVMFLYVAGGVTTVRGMQGNEAQFGLRDRVNSGDLLGPNLTLGSPSLHGGRVKTPEEARQFVRQYKEEGYDLLKVHEGLSFDTYMALVDEANKQGIRFAGHITDTVTVEQALDAGQDTIEHMDNYVAEIMAVPEGERDAKMAELVAMTKAKNGWIVPTDVLFQRFFDPSDAEIARLDELKYVSADTIAGWKRRHESFVASFRESPEQGKAYSMWRKKLLKALADADVNILLGSDAPQVYSVPGFSVQREMEGMQDVGISIADILDSGTHMGGVYSNEAYGLIKAGYRADILLLDEDPRQDLSAFRALDGVMVKGYWHSGEEIQKRLNDMADRYAKDK